MKRRDFLASAATVGAATMFGLSGEGSQAPVQGERQGKTHPVEPRQDRARLAIEQRPVLVREVGRTSCRQCSVLRDCCTAVSAAGP